MSFVKYTFTFISGLYIGQRYGKTLPNIQKVTIDVCNRVKQTDFFKEVMKDIKK